MSEAGPSKTPRTLSPPVRLHHALEAIWGTPPGGGQLKAVNHTIVGKRFMVTALVFFAIGGLLAMLIRTQLATSHSGFMDAEEYAQVFTMHGVVMMFLFAIPFFEGLAMYLLPKMLGSRDLAFPRLSAYGYWCYLFGGAMLITALLLGSAPDGGWFMYTPLSSRPFSPGINADVWLLGITFVEISAVTAAVEIMVTVLKVRAPRMSLDRMPIFAWYMLVVGAMMLIGFPPLILGSILLEVERAFDMPFFDPDRGGDPLLWQHLFWLFGHPEVYIIFLPAAGVISTVLPVFAGRPLAGYRIIVAAIVAMAFLSFGLWVHHMYTVGIPHVALSFFSGASALVAIPTAIQIFAWLGTLAHGRPRLSVPMLYICGFFFVFVIGGLTGVMLAMVPFDLQAHDSQFVVAHLHYVLFGGFVFPMLAGAYYWLPHLTGRQPVQHLSHAAFWAIFIGFNLTFLIMHLTGLLGMPRRIYAYPEVAGWDLFNLISSIGGFITTMGLALVALDMILLIRFGKRFRRDPWEAGTLEWATPTPPPSYNFASLPRIEERADRLAPARLGAELAAGGGFLGHIRNGWMETLGCNMVTGGPEQVIVLPRQTSLPLWTALATGLFFMALLFKVYWLSIVALALVVVLFLCWTPSTGLRTDLEPLQVGHDVAVEHHQMSKTPPSWWAMVLTLAANATLYGSLVFGGFFLWLSAPNWPPAEETGNSFLASLLAGLALVAASVAGRLAVARADRATLWLLLVGGSHLIACFALARILQQVVPAPTQHAAGAAMFAVAFYALMHAVMGAVLAGYGIWRVKGGYVSARRTLDLRIAALWHDYTAVTGIVALLFPLALAGLVKAGGAG